MALLAIAKSQGNSDQAHLDHHIQEHREETHQKIQEWKNLFAPLCENRRNEIDQSDHDLEADEEAEVGCHGIPSKSNRLALGKPS